MNHAEFLRRAAVEHQTRRFFLKSCTACIGGLAFNALLSRAFGSEVPAANGPHTHHPARAKRVIYIHLAGAPSHLETFDYKPELAKLDGKPCPDSFLKGKRFAFLKGVPNMLGPQYKFAQYGDSGAWVCEHLPNLAGLVNDLCLVKSMWTEQFNHAPAQLMLQTGSQLKGRPCLGSWAYYGLGTENQDLPDFIGLTSGGKNPDAGKTNARATASRFFSPKIPKASAATSGARPLTLSTKSTRRPPRNSATRRPSPASANTSWLSACR